MTRKLTRQELLEMCFHALQTGATRRRLREAGNLGVHRLEVELQKYLARGANEHRTSEKAI